MKRVGNLMENVCDFQHLHKSYKKALKGSGNTPEAMTFQFHAETELLNLQAALESLTYQPEPYEYFFITKPKRRKISVAPFRDRVAHHAIVGVLEPIFEKVFIYHSYATRKNKGTHKAVLQAQHFLKKYPWYFKADIDQYFAGIDHKILLDLIRRKIKDQDLLDIIHRIIQNGGPNGKGLPIGNLTSQFFANVYLNSFDHFVKEELQIKGYVRYMDDFVIYGNEKRALKNLISKIEVFLRDHLQLKLKSSACFLQPRHHGISFLGTRIFTDLIRVHPVNLKRHRQNISSKVHAYQQGRLGEQKFLEAMSSHWAHLSYFDTYLLRHQLLANTKIGHLT